MAAVPYHSSMELIFNCAWAFLSIALLAAACHQVRRGRVSLPMASALALALMIAIILLPVISISDDILDAQQSALPISGQLWRIATQDASSIYDRVLVLGAFLLCLLACLSGTRRLFQARMVVRPLAGRLARSQRLRPPPAFAF